MGVEVGGGWDGGDGEDSEGRVVVVDEGARGLCV